MKTIFQLTVGRAYLIATLLFVLDAIALGALCWLPFKEPRPLFAEPDEDFSWLLPALILVGNGHRARGDNVDRAELPSLSERIPGYSHRGIAAAAYSDIDRDSRSRPGNVGLNLGKILSA